MILLLLCFVGVSLSCTITLGSTETMQGQEADLVIVYTIRPNPNGDMRFLNNSERWNVIISRPRSGLVVLASLGCWRNAREAEMPPLFGLCKRANMVTRWEVVGDRIVRRPVTEVDPDQI